MREWRKSHPLGVDAKLRANARSYAKTYRRRGKLVAGLCADCGTDWVEMHHEDYGKPLDVVWLCRGCHLGRHRREGLR